MNQRMEPRGIRPSEDIIRRRLVERRLAHDRAKAEQRWLSRKPKTPAGEGSRLAASAGRRKPITTRLRERPVASFLSATIVGIAVIGAIGTFLRMDGIGPNDGAASSPVRLASSQSGTSAGDDTSGVAAVSNGRSGQPSSAHRAASLRETTGTLPPTVREAASTSTPKIDLSNRAVEAALALRMPQEVADAGGDQPDRLTTTGSISRVETSDPVAPARLADDLQRQAAALGGANKTEPGSTSKDEAGERETSTAPVGETATKAANVTAAVNLRAKPNNGATVLRVLPKGSAVMIKDCSSWCEVVADGLTGYVFKSFVSQSG